MASVVNLEHSAQVLRSLVGTGSSSLTATMLTPTKGLGGSPTSLILSARSGLLWALVHTHVIVKITAAGVPTIVAGKLNRAGYKDGKPTDAMFNFGYWLSGITELASGDLVFTDPLNHAIRYLRADESNVATFAGAGRPGYQDGALNEALFDHPTSLVFANTGALFVCDTHNKCVRMIKDNMVSTLGSGPSDPDPISDFVVLSGIAYHPKGQLLVSDAMDHSLSRVTQARVTNLTGSTQGYVDGAIDEARLSDPLGLVLTPLSDLLVCDSGNSAIRMLTGGQICTVFAPQGTPTLSSASQLSGARLSALFPRAVTLGAEGLLYVADLQGIVVLSGPANARVPTPHGARKGPQKAELQKALYEAIHTGVVPLIDIFQAQRQNLDPTLLLLRIVKSTNLLLSKCGKILASSTLDEAGEKALRGVISHAISHLQELTQLVIVSPFSADIPSTMGKLKACLISFSAITGTS